MSYFTQNIVRANDIVLDSSAASRFNTTSTVGELVEELMVENWTHSIIYENYFSACQPTHCSYTIKTRNSAATVIITVTSLLGGLTSVLEIVIPYFVRFVTYVIRRRNRIPPIASGNHLVVEDLNY